MDTSRREFLKTSAAVGSGVYLGLWGCAPEERVAAPNPLRILILGGTGFIGPHQVRYALERGHSVTLFNRGMTNPELFPEVEKLIGDRNNDPEALKGREWDVVIDNPSMEPAWVRLSAEVLKDSVQQYLFISTLSVYSDSSVVNQDETGVLSEFDEEADEVVTGIAYGGKKVLCEGAAEAVFPGRTTVVRPGLITGPGDPTMRFPYWPVRVNRGGEVLVPGLYEDPVQFIDARDLGGFVIRLCEDSVHGTFNATGPSREPIPMGRMLEEVRTGLESDATFTWVDEAFLNEREILRRVDSLGSTTVRMEEYRGYNQFNVDKAVEAGLIFRPVGETGRDTVDWFKSLPEDERPRSRALSPEEEAEILTAWHEANPTGG